MSRHHCQVVLLAGKAIDSSGWPTSQSTVCEKCQGCESYSANMGLASGSVELMAMDAGQKLALVWSCPGCGVSVSESTTPLASIEASLLVEKDPLCWRCRN